MSKHGKKRKKLEKLNRATHRDVGYFISTLVIIYCLSGLALNHLDDWNPDFIINKKEIVIPESIDIEYVNAKDIVALSELVGESSYKIYDKPTPDQLKIYYDNASLHVNSSTGIGTYERISKRPIFYQTNVLHRNSLKGWKWVSDIFAVVLILVSITGLFILKGKKGFKGRGKWLVLSGALVPVIAWLIFMFS
ncbi:MAG: hypothetical protein COA58_14690 [Bacteroidetes bacterium]|nr:MAG: hypothetical protein COA58_14690 [Bacteroidota bacterium]